MTFAQPFWLLLLLSIPWLLRYLRKEAGPTMRMPYLFSAKTWRTILRPTLRWMYISALALLIIAMARPQRAWQETKVMGDAIDIVLTMDISLSMLGRDFEPDRLTVAKKVAADFVEKRAYDRIGLVAFAGEAFTVCPPTTDRRVLQQFIKELTVGRIEHGTAIGVGLATAVNRLKDSPAKSRVIILLTDGENRSLEDDITPEQATDMAALYGIRVYTLGIGSDGDVSMPYDQGPDGEWIYRMVPGGFNTTLLEKIATATNGKFYRAFSAAELRGIYAEIDRLEKTKIEVKTLQRTADYFQWPLGIACILLLLSALLRWGLLRTVTDG